MEKLITVGGIINHVKGMVTKRKGTPMGLSPGKILPKSKWLFSRQLGKSTGIAGEMMRPYFFPDVQHNERTVHILAERIALLDDVKQRKEDQIAQRGHIRALHLYRMNGITPRSKPSAGSYS